VQPKEISKPNALRRSRRPSREHIDASDTKLPRDLLFRGAAKRVKPLTHGDIDEADPPENIN
jgi:hypothetical protein